jgi:hypothetical protein
MIGVAGCGGGSSNSSSAATTTEAQSVTKPASTASLAKFITVATQICEQGDRRKSEGLEAAASGKGLNVTQLEGEHLITAVVLPIYAEVDEELATLPMPKGHEAEVESIIAGVKAGIIKSESEPLLALQGKAFMAPDEAVTELGVTGCIF